MLFATGTKASTIRVNHATDYWYQFDTTTDFTVRTYQVDGYWSDPHLWFYNADGQLLAANDDWYGLQSNIQITVQPGWYRLRAGVCCGNPDNWWSGVQYDLATSFEPLQPTTSAATTSSSTTTTTLPEPTTTTEDPTSSTVESTTTTLQASSTVATWLETTTTTEPPTTTLSLPTSSSTTTTQPDPTTTTSTSTLPPLTTSTVESTTTTEPPSSSSTQTSSTTSPPSSLRSTSTTGSTVSPTTTSLVMRPVASTLNVPSSTNANLLIPTTTSLPIEPQSPDEAIAVLTEVSSPEEAAAAIAEIADNIDTLTAEQLNNIAKVVSQAPKEVKQAFEQQVNIFGGGLDSYVPADSNVTVGQRRALVAIGAILTASPVLVSRRK